MSEGSVIPMAILAALYAVCQAESAARRGLSAEFLANREVVRATREILTHVRHRRVERIHKKFYSRKRVSTREKDSSVHW